MSRTPKRGAGRCSRLQVLVVAWVSELPKQYLEVAGATLLEHSLRALLRCEQLAGVVVALHPEDSRAAGLPVFQDPRVHSVTGAEQRSGSVLAGLDSLVSLAAPMDWVLVHDAARPCLQLEDIQRLIAAVMAGDTGGFWPSRSRIPSSRPQMNRGFCVPWTALPCGGPRLRRCFVSMSCDWHLAQAQEQGLAVTDEASAMEMAGYPVQLISRICGQPEGDSTR